MKDLANKSIGFIVITIAYFALYGAISIVDERVEAQEVMNMNLCTLEDVFCYGEPISEVDTTPTMPVEANIRHVARFTDRKQLVGNDKKEIFKDICKKHDIYNETCWKYLYSIMTVESGGDTKAIGDNFLARGAFQIHYKLHNISIQKKEIVNSYAK